MKNRKRKKLEESICDRTWKLIEENSGHVIRYDELPRTAQLALAWYLSVDNDDWERPPRVDESKVEASADWRRGRLKGNPEWLKKALPFYRKHHGKERFGYVVIPTVDLIANAMRNPDLLKRFPDFPKYHRWFFTGKHRTSVQVENPWPVVLDTEPGTEEILEDGYHRFHRYYSQGVEQIPALYFP